MVDRDPQHPTSDEERECPAFQAGLDCMKEIPASHWSGDANLKTYLDWIWDRWNSRCAGAGIPLDFGDLPVDRTVP